MGFWKLGWAAQWVSGLALGLCAAGASATEGGLGRPVSGTTVQANGGIVLPEPAWIVTTLVF